MHHPITRDYVATRFDQFVAKFRTALETLGYSAEDVGVQANALATRLQTRDFKVYGDQPIHELHAGKRITRALVKFAIVSRPAEKARRARLRDAYAAKCAEVRKTQPHAVFFSFEAARANALKVDLRPFKALFQL